MLLNKIIQMYSYAHSLEDPGTSDPEESRDEPNTFQENYDDINVDHLLNNFQLVGADTHTYRQMFVLSEVWPSLTYYS